MLSVTTDSFPYLPDTPFVPLTFQRYKATGIPF